MAIVVERPAVASGEDVALAARAGTRMSPLFTTGDDTPRPTRHDSVAALLMAVGEYGAIAIGALCSALLRAFIAHATRERRPPAVQR